MNTSTPPRTVVITGASGALGRAVVQAFADEGAALALIDRDEGALRQAFGTLGERMLPLAADVSDEASLQRAADAVARRFGGADVVVHVAGGFEMGEAVHELSRASWDRMMNLNAWSFAVLMRAFVPQMLSRGAGRVVAVSAASAASGAAAKAAYVASKSALQRLVESASLELRDKGISVNSVAPTIMDTPANRGAMPDADTRAWVSTADAARAIAYLASDAARVVHGQHLVLGSA